MSSDYPPANEKRELYRDPSRGKICGICVGLADYFSLEVWVVRIIAVTALLFFQFPIFIAYIVAFLVLDAKPGTTKYEKFSGFRRRAKNQPYQPGAEKRDGGFHAASVQQVWKKGRIPTQTLKGLKGRFQKLETRLRSIETYVTSKQFELRKEFEELSS